MATVEIRGLLDKFIFKDVHEGGVDYVDIYPAINTPLVMRLNAIRLEDIYNELKKKFRK